jgi:hypothetical protein
MNARLASCATLAATLVALGNACCHAATVTDWRTYRGTAATTLAGQGTGSPTVGNLTGQTASTAVVLGYLDTPAVLGTDVGDTVTLSFNVKFNDLTGMSNSGDQFRFALFDLNGEPEDSISGGASGSENYATAGTTNTNNFRGYWFGHRGGGGAGAPGSMRERPAALTGSNNPFTNSAGDPAPSLGPVGGSSVPLSGDVNGNGAGPTYIGQMILTRNSLGGIDLSGIFQDSNAASGNVFSATDSTPNAGSYGAVGFLIGGSMNVEQVIFSDVDVTAVPEPASVLLLVSGAIGLLRLRRRREAH